MEGVADEISLLVWDAESSPPSHPGITVLWSTVPKEGGEGVVSLPLLVEQDANTLRARYLAWVHDLGNVEVDGRPLIDKFALRPGFSYWWMTPLAEKCNYSKSPQIDQAIRLIAFDLWAGETSGFKRLLIATSNAQLAECFRSWCKETGVEFVWEKHPPRALIRPSLYKRLENYLPHVLQAGVWFVRYLVQRWPLQGVGVSSWKTSAATATFISYSANLRLSSLESGRFESAYWGNLPAVLEEAGTASNWLHLYVADQVLPTLSVAKRAFCRLNREEAGNRVHVTLDSFLGIKTVAKSLRDWVCLWRYRKLPLAGASRLSKSTRFDLWPLFESEWAQSFIGKIALSNVLYLNLVESAVENLPTQRAGVYLQENQPWELAFSHAWKRAGHGRLIGAPHSSVRFWDLRYFFDARDYSGMSSCRLPLPDLVAVNGPVAMEALNDGGFPAERLIEVEALRYGYMLEAQRGNTADRVNRGTRPPRILVLTDYDAGHTRKQLNLLAETLKLLPSNAQITVKYHPALPLGPADLPGQCMKIADRPLPEMLAMADVAYASAVTSAAVDAYCAGLPVVALFDPGSLNMSPLRGLDKVAFVHSPEQLAHALMDVPLGRDHESSAENFFTLDKMLPRWRRLLALADDPAAVRHTGN